MSFDVRPMHFENDSYEAKVIESVMIRDDVSAEEAVRRALRSVQVAILPGEEESGDLAAAPVADELTNELRQFKALYPGLGKFEDVTDEQWENILMNSHDLSLEGIQIRA